jgi:hypothetical protein
MMPLAVKEQAPVPPPSFQRGQARLSRALHIDAQTLVTTLHLLALCRLAVRLAHRRCPPPLPAGKGGRPRTYSQTGARPSVEGGSRVMKRPLHNSNVPCFVTPELPIDFIHAIYHHQEGPNSPRALWVLGPPAPYQMMPIPIPQVPSQQALQQQAPPHSRMALYCPYHVWPQ